MENSGKENSLSSAFSPHPPPHTHTQSKRESKETTYRENSVNIKEFGKTSYFEKMYKMEEGLRIKAKHKGDPAWIASQSSDQGEPCEISWRL